MQRQQQGRIGEALQHLEEAAADLLQPLTPVLTAVHRGQDHTLALEIEAGQFKRRGLFGHQQQGIDHGVAGDAHLPHHA